MKNKDYHLIEDFLEDASFVAWVHHTNPEAVRFWNKWQIEHPEQTELLETAKAIVKGFQFEPQYLEMAEVNSEWDKLTQRILERDNLGPRVSQVKRIGLNRHTIVRIAAAVACLIAIGFLVQKYSGTEKISYYADFGKRQEIKLPDGTQLTLNANSTLRYEKENPRKVWLDGEAFFMVAKKTDTNKKFEVVTPDLIVEVYGTEFNVNSRKKQTQVVLEEGKVKLALSNGIQREMQPGDLLTYTAEGNRIIEEKKLERLETLTSWKEGTLIFDNISLSDAMGKIGELYGLKIVFEEANIANEPIHLAVPTDDINICLQAIEHSGSIPIRIEKAGNTLKVNLLKN